MFPYKPKSKLVPQKMAASGIKTNNNFKIIIIILKQQQIWIYIVIYIDKIVQPVLIIRYGFIQNEKREK